MSLFCPSESNCFARWTTTFVSSWPLSALEMDNSNAGVARNARSSSPPSFFSRFRFSRRYVVAASNMPRWPSWTGLNDPLKTTFAVEHPIVSSLPPCIEYTLRSGVFLDAPPLSSLLLLLLLLPLPSPLLFIALPTSNHLSNKDFFVFIFSFAFSNQGASYSKNSNLSSLHVNAPSRNAFQDSSSPSSLPLKLASSSSSSSSSSLFIHLSPSPIAALTKHSLATRSSSALDRSLSLSSVTFLVVTPNLE